MKFSLPICGTLALAGLAMLAPLAAQAEDAVAPAAQPKPKVVCRRSPDTGSLVPKKTCHTTEQWASIDKASEEASRRTTDRMMSGAAPGAPPEMGGH